MSGTSLRIVTAAILIPAVVVAVWWAPLNLLTALAGVIAVLALWEFFALGDRMGIHAYRYWAALAALAIFAQQCYTATEAANGATLADLLSGARTRDISLASVLLIFVLGLAAVALARNQPVSEVLPSVSLSAAGLMFVVLPFSAVVRLAGVEQIGRKLLLFTLVLVWVGDTAAYFIGRWFGRAKLAPQWSPNKTWEGAAANLIGASLVAALFGRWLDIPLAQVVIMAGLASVAGQLGDIFESALKRSAGAKDSGAILPGHGGVYDRIDALIFAAPVVWYYFEWMVRTPR